MAPTEIYTLSLHDALPIYPLPCCIRSPSLVPGAGYGVGGVLAEPPGRVDSLGSDRGRPQWRPRCYGLRFGEVALEWERVLFGPGRPIGAGGSGPEGGGGRRRPRGGLGTRVATRPSHRMGPPGWDQVVGRGGCGNAAGRLELVHLGLQGGEAVLGGAVALLQAGDGERLLVDADVEGQQAEHPGHDRYGGHDDEGQARHPVHLGDHPEAVAEVVAALRGRARIRLRTADGTGGQAHCGCPPCAGVGAPASFSAARSLALSARGLASISAELGVTGRLVRMRSCGSRGMTCSGRSTEWTLVAARSAKTCLTMRSSREW